SITAHRLLFAARSIGRTQPGHCSRAVAHVPRPFGPAHGKAFADGLALASGAKARRARRGRIKWRAKSRSDCGQSLSIALSAGYDRGRIVGRRAEEAATAKMTMTIWQIGTEWTRLL